MNALPPSPATDRPDAEQTAFSSIQNATFRNDTPEAYRAKRLPVPDDKDAARGLDKHEGNYRK